VFIPKKFSFFFEINMNKFDSSIQLTVMAEGAIVWVAERLGYDNIKYKVIHICKSIAICTSYNISFCSIW